MSGEDDPKALKELRSKLRGRVTTAANNLIRRTEHCSNVNDLASDEQALLDAFDEFTVCQLTYEELVGFEDKHESYRTVGGLDLEAYSKSVQKSFNDALSAYNSLKDTAITSEGTLILTRAEAMLKELDTLINKSEFELSDISIARSALEETVNIIDIVKPFVIRLSTVKSLSELLTKVQSCVFDMDIKFYEVKHLLYSCESNYRNQSGAHVVVANRDADALPSEGSPSGLSGVVSPSVFAGAASQLEHTNEEQAASNGPSTSRSGANSTSPLSTPEHDLQVHTSNERTSIRDTQRPHETSQGEQTAGNGPSTPRGGAESTSPLAHLPYVTHKYIQVICVQAYATHKDSMKQVMGNKQLAMCQAVCGDGLRALAPLAHLPYKTYKPKHATCVQAYTIHKYQAHQVAYKHPQTTPQSTH